MTAVGYYCNSLFYGLSDTSNRRLQSVQNSLARAILPSIKRSDHITPTLVKLHWLPIHNRVKLYVVYHHFQGSENRQPSYSTCLTYFNFIILKDLFALLISCFSTHPKSKLPLPLAPFRMLRLSTCNSLPIDL